MTKYLWIVVFLLIYLYIRENRRIAAVQHIQNRKKHKKENTAMKELAMQFIGEECIIYTITSNSGSIQGVIREVDDGGMIIEGKNGEREIINLDYITRIRQYPGKKKAKKKMA